MKTTQQEFEHAMRAFDLFDIYERERALTIFAGLRYPSIQDRFFEAVHHVVTTSPATRASHGTPEQP
jgi:hypothetical protein